MRAPTTGLPTWHDETTSAGRTLDMLNLDIDHVVVDSKLAVDHARVLDAGHSDHRPVTATIHKR